MAYDSHYERLFRLCCLIGCFHCCLAWVLPATTTARSSTSLAAASASTTPRDDDHSLVQVLRQYGYDQRLETIRQESLPRLAEIFVNGESTMAQIVSFQHGGSDQPKVEVQVRPGLVPSETAASTIHHDPATSIMIDLGQITTIWDSDVSSSSSSSFLHDTNTIMTDDSAQREVGQKTVVSLPDTYMERQLDVLYKSRVGRARTNNRKGGLTKKQVARAVADMFENSNNDKDMDRATAAETVLRQVLKAGKGFSRLVDSSLVRDSLYEDFRHNNHDPRDPALLVTQQAFAAYCLSRDASLGGRFKRWPCLFVDQQEQSQSRNSITSDDTSKVQLASVTIINGGWLVVDQSVRAGTEARKFVQRSEQQITNHSTAGKLVTLADERIVQRLECLAMGELFAATNQISKNSNNEDGEQDPKLELDVQETLNAMNLPPTPEGAKTALTRIGRWTVADDGSATAGSRNRIQFWPQPVLDAASWYVQYSKTRRSQDVVTSENRVDLTHLPCISVDATRATFRDDAIGIRPRAGTGRRVIEQASKWEILLHIADASDIFTPDAVSADGEGHLSLLRDAAESRGTSRYDLPSGPLHLLPPVVLKELCLRSGVPGNRCVTLWAYIDERNGRLLEAGIERSFVSPAIELSFLEASNLMDGKESSQDLMKARPVLLVAERNLKCWSKARLDKSGAARNREDRMSSKELRVPFLKGMRDDGHDGFFRSRGHRLVDSALDMYAYAVAGLLRGAGAPVPRAKGADASRGGRLATSPLRRFIDGQAQQQVLAVCCDFGRPMNPEECFEAGKKANDARNVISNIRATKNRN